MTTLSRRFSGAFLLLVAMPSLVVSVILSRLYLTALRRTVELHSQATADQVAQNVRAETEGMAILAAALFHDGELRRLASGYAQAEGPTERYVSARALDEKLVSFFTYSNRVGEVVLYLGAAGVYRYANAPRLMAGPPVELDDLAGAAADPGKVFLLDTLDATHGSEHTMSIAVWSAPDDPSAATALLVRLRVPAFDALAAGPAGDGGPDVVMLSRSGQPILSSLPADALDGALTRELAARTAASGTPGAGGERSSFRALQAGRRSWLATVQPLESTGWTLVLLVDEAALSQRVTRYAWYLYPAIALLAALFIAYASRLAAERERIERDRLAAELEALRYQINPHFIANTLNSIRLMASAARADAIASMTRDLMRLVSDSYSGASALTELSRELASISAYVGIMKVRFGERFVLEIDAAPDTESLLVLRMLLQPIVENAILHGFAGAANGRSGRASRGTIRVSARRERRAVHAPPSPEPSAAAVPGEVLVLEVHDDGAGMARDAAAPTRPAGRGPESLHRIGVANVERRIALNFGAPYGLVIESEPGAFTRVRYVLPALVRTAAELAPREAPREADHA
ncbi:MAG TPA: histidine kinase [Kofleriaceae bacterium]|jgi:two-component system sensor histidine kinase YesM|nr:histidine kinase [Kofleriaceae bacterium]